MSSPVKTCKIRKMRLLAAAVFAAVLVPDFAFAGWREDMGIFRIGMVAQDRTPGELARLRDAYSTVLGMNAEIVPVSDLAALIDAQASSRVDYAIYTALAYGAADRLCACVEPLAAPVSADGATGLRAVLIGRKGAFDSLSAGISGEGAAAKLAIGPLDSAPAALLLNAGLSAGDRKLAAGSDALMLHPTLGEAVDAFAAGAANALLGWTPSNATGVLEGGVTWVLKGRGVPENAWHVLWTSAHLPNGPHAVRKSLPSEAKTLLAGFLTGLAASSPETYEALEHDFGGGFVKVSAADYELAAQLAGQLAGKP